MGITNYGGGYSMLIENIYNQIAEIEREIAVLPEEASQKEDQR